MSALKFDQEKPRMDLLSRVALEGCAWVLTFGARKYADNNWRKGFKWSRLIGAAMRHLTAIMDGEDTDPESGLPHVDHLACCVMFLSEHQKKNLGEDDRWKYSNEKKTEAGSAPIKNLSVEPSASSTSEKPSTLPQVSETITTTQQLYTGGVREYNAISSSWEALVSRDR